MRHETCLDFHTYMQIRFMIFLITSVWESVFYLYLSSQYLGGGYGGVRAMGAYCMKGQIAVDGKNRGRQKWKWRQEKREKEVSAPAASGLYFPRHSDFILATNKERALCVSMVTPVQATMERIKGQEREYILAWGGTFFFTSFVEYNPFPFSSVTYL